MVAGNHEFSSGQFEINLWHSDALDAADRAFRFKSAVQELARMSGRSATFMAKPFNDEGGSGFHIHFSASSDDGDPLFDDPNGQDGLSDVARYAIAGVLAHAPALAALHNPTINSYKRFGPDTLAPWLIDWGLDNRSAMVRVPPERGKSTRMEVRLGDASANPYLAIAGVLAAAHLGMERKLEAPAPLEGYGYDVTKSPKLPDNLGAALDALEGDAECMRRADRSYGLARRNRHSRRVAAVLIRRLASDRPIDNANGPMGISRDFRIVRDEDHGHALVADAGDQLPRLAARLRIEAGGELVEDRELGASDQGERDRYALALTT